MSKRLSKKKWKKRRKIRVAIAMIISFALIFIVLGLVWSMLDNILFNGSKGFLSCIKRTETITKPEISERFLTPNQYSRPGTTLRKVKGVVIHYTANPGTDAENNRDYFEGLKDTGKTSVSSHFIIGLDGSIIQCIPLDEIAYASNERNVDTLSIECCHPDETGEFTEKTYDALVQLTAWLCGEYNLKQDDILRHYDVTGKDCPRYFVQNVKKWIEFQKEVIRYTEEHREK